MTTLILPNFLIIGAAKSATSWLIARLAQHPHVYAYDQEIHFFSHHYTKGSTWYAKHFCTGNHSVGIGEKSNSYLGHVQAPLRIQALLPQVKLIAILRNPTERAYSGYCMRFAQGIVSAEIDSYLDPDKSRSDGCFQFVRQGLYAQHLRRYFAVFKADQLKVVLFDDLQADSHTFLNDITGFLGLEPFSVCEERHKPVNVRRTRVYPTVLQALQVRLEEIPPAKAAVGKIATSFLGQRVKARLATQSVEYPALSQGLREKLINYYTPHIIELETLIGKDLSGWRKQSQAHFGWPP